MLKAISQLMFWTVSFSALAQGVSSKYTGSLNCLKNLHERIQPTESRVAFTPAGVAIVKGGSAESGYYALTPKGAFFVAESEMAVSTDSTSGDHKITIVVPGQSPIKFFTKTNTDTGGIYISAANEFDRQVYTSAVEEDQVRLPLQLAIETAFRAGLPQVQKKSKTFGNALQTCAQSGVDFKMLNDKGIDSTFQSEIAKAQEKMKPGMFTKEYWLSR